MDNIIDLLLVFYGPASYFIIFGILLICGLGVPIPEDITLLGAGLCAYYGSTNLILTIIVSYFGVMIGDGVIFFLGHFYGERILQHQTFHKLFSLNRKEAVQKMFAKRGNLAIFFGRFMPGLRAPIFFFSGLLKVPAKSFLFWDGLAAFLSVPAIISAVYYFGDELDMVIRVVKKVEHGIMLIVIIAVLFMAKIIWMRKRAEQ
jgi:membrane protein DedA with SNARE-associated domain